MCRSRPWWSRRPSKSDEPSLIHELQAPPSWRRLVFISDLHLGADTPATFAALRDALRGLAADALFILGDLCEAWVGDDAIALPWAQALAAELKAASAGRPLYFQHGNRDFLLGSAMAEACGMQLLGEVVHLRAFGQAVVLVHGDAQCLDDADYQAFRAQVRQPLWQQAFLAQPLERRLHLATQMRDASRQAQGAQHGDYGDLDPAACQALLDAAGARTLLHGHTHRPGRSALPKGERLVLSDWDFDHGGARGEWLVLNAAGWQRQALA